ncbi:MAG: glycosyltransferase [Anaerovibrio sp.]|nr:glycosyltransferase [Anaerovibrio sp.]
MKIMLANFAKMANDSGGLAKVTVAFANEMVRRGHDVLLAYMDENNGKFFYKIDEKVQLNNLCWQNGRCIKFPLWMKLKREVLRTFSSVKSRDVNDEFMQKYLMDEVSNILGEFKPDIIISSQPAASRILLCDIGIDIPVITMSHGDPEDYFHTYPKGELPALGKSAACQVLMPSFAENIKKRFPDEKVVVIGNVVPQYDEQADLATDKGEYKIIFIGRLVKNHKRPHLLISAFAQLAKDFPAWSVELWGAESNKVYIKSLKSLIADNNLTDRVFLKGVTKDVPQVLSKGDIFVLPSAYEGFGLSLAEGMSMGLPAVGYKNCAAVNELIVDGENGFLCDDGVNPLADALRKLMENRELRIQMGQSARNSMEKYSAENIWNQWMQLIHETISGQKGND